MKAIFYCIKGLLKIILTIISIPILLILLCLSTLELIGSNGKSDILDGFITKISKICGLDRGAEMYF